MSKSSEAKKKKQKKKGQPYLGLLEGHPAGEHVVPQLHVEQKPAQRTRMVVVGRKISGPWQSSPPPPEQSVGKTEISDTVLYAFSPVFGDKQR